VNRRIPFLSLVPRGEDEHDLRSAVDRVIARGWFVLGPECEAFESEFAEASQAACAVGTGTGTDAIALIRPPLNIGPAD
jgi:dTDP-4-amino-4,6-dideoxygalactose transaminase